MAALVAHRGDAARFPENTVPALRGALDAGARWLECDVQLSRDRVPMLLHDGDLARTFDDPRSVFDLDADALALLGVPTLKDAIALLGGFPDATLFVEIKQESIDRFGHDAIVGEVRSACEPAAARCVVISFNAQAVGRAARAGLRTGWVLSEWDDTARSTAEALAPEFVFTNVKRVPAGAALWPGTWRWVAYDAKTADDALAIAARGFELIETMDIKRLLADPRIALWAAP